MMTKRNLRGQSRKSFWNGTTNAGSFSTTGSPTPHSATKSTSEWSEKIRESPENVAKGKDDDVLTFLLGIWTSVCFWSVSIMSSLRYPSAISWYPGHPSSILKVPHSRWELLASASARLSSSRTMQDTWRGMKNQNKMDDRHSNCVASEKLGRGGTDLEGMWADLAALQVSVGDVQRLAGDFQLAVLHLAEVLALQEAVDGGLAVAVQSWHLKVLHDKMIWLSRWISHNGAHLSALYSPGQPSLQPKDFLFKLILNYFHFGLIELK